VRKAEKIRTYIRQNQLEAHITVPRKYLYWNEQESQFYTVAEKVKLSKYVATPASKEIETAFKADTTVGGQGQALANNAPKKKSNSHPGYDLSQIICFRIY